MSKARIVRQLDVEVLPQPDGTTCGPTCLQAVYNFWDHTTTLDEVIGGILALPDGGTLAVTLACDALARGFEATIYTYNLQTFDPTWFPDTGGLEGQLRRQSEAKHDPKLSLASEAYLLFLGLGGKVAHELLTKEFLRDLMDQGAPVLTGLSATYLYGCAREYQDEYDDIRGEPTGHFVALCGYDADADVVFVADPYPHTKLNTRRYAVRTDRLIAAILLGIVTYDANLLVIAPTELPAS